MSTHDSTLVFDTETTGLANFKGPLADQPSVVQLAAELYDVAWRPVATLSIIVRTVVEVPTQSSDIHGITEGMVADFGVEPKTALAMFNRLVRRAGRVVAHNLDFDDLIMRAAYYQNKAACPLDEHERKGCTMKTLTPVLKIPGKYGNKWPNLQEAHKWATGEGFEGAHDALVDVRACARVLRECDKQGIKVA